MEDLEELRSTIKMLSHYKTMPGNEWMEEVISSLEYRFGVKPDAEKLIDFEKNDLPDVGLPCNAETSLMTCCI